MGEGVDFETLARQGRGAAQPHSSRPRPFRLCRFIDHFSQASRLSRPEGGAAALVEAGACLFLQFTVFLASEASRLSRPEGGAAALVEAGACLFLQFTVFSRLEGP